MKKEQPKPIRPKQKQVPPAIEDIPLLYFEKPYYLEPEKKAGKAYQLLNQALKESKKVAIAHFVFHNKEHIGAILPQGNILMLIQMRYHLEVRSSESLDVPEEKISKKELEMALGLIKQLTSQFEPEKHHDTYAEEIMNLIENKLKGKKIKPAAKKKAPVYEIQDLMDLLQASMEQVKPKKIASKQFKKKKSA